MNLRSLLVVVLSLMLPVWLLAGLGDWLCHRRSHIEHTSGPRESALHLLLYLLIAAPIVLGLFLAIDALLLTFMTACVLAHMAVALWDSSFAQPRRYISPLEQHIHSYQDMLPLFALVLVYVLHWEAVQNPAWTLTRRAEPLPAPWPWAVVVALFPGLSLIVEELLRGLRVRSGGADSGR